MKDVFGYFIFTLLVWSLLAIIVAVVFNIAFTMHPSDAAYTTNQSLSQVIAGLCCVPAWFIVCRIYNKLK